MKASEYIAHLQAITAEYGDLDCVDSYGDLIGTPEYNDDETDNPCFVLASEA